MGNPWINGEFLYKVAKNNIFTKDDDNYINGVGIQELDTVGELYLLDIYLSKDNYVDLHYHSNASELTYCMSGAAEICFINPTTEAWQCFKLTPGKVVSIPQGFWHEAKALEDETHLLATHDTDNLQTTFGSDLLRLTPKEVMANIYCLDEEELEEVLAPIDETIAIGPPVGCRNLADDMSDEQKEQISLNRNEDIPNAALERGGHHVENANEMNENRMRERNEQQSNETVRAIPRVENSLYTCPICRQQRNHR